VVTQDEVERRVASCAQALKAAGLRLTHQRLEVAREVARSDTHPDVETVYRGVRERVPTISLDTVYRTLAVLEGLGLIRRFDLTAGPARYDANLEPHHHFICTKCGLIRDVQASVVDGLKVSEESAKLGRVEWVTVQLRGLCRECQGSEDYDERTREASDH
jgi:Fur family peroxide stress response transcriptional regulator